MKKLIILALMYCFIPVFLAACGDDISQAVTNYSLTLEAYPDSETVSKATFEYVTLRARVYNSSGSLIENPGNIDWVLKYMPVGESKYIKIPDERFTSSKPYTEALLNIKLFFPGDVIEISAQYANAKDTITFTIVE